jgi:hypothetical protein
MIEEDNRLISWLKLSGFTTSEDSQSIGEV